MNAILIVNIKQLLMATKKNLSYIRGKKMDKIPIIENAYLYIEGNKIVDFGKMEDLQAKEARIYSMVNEVIDANGRIVLPTYCDSHTHIAYVGDRVKEFVYKIKGLSYLDISKKGGGILSTVKLVRKASEEEIYQETRERIIEMIKLGTGAIEIKSGYGLDTENELKLLRVIKKLKNDLPIKIKATFLGAHAIPPEYKDNPNEYVNIIINEMLPQIANEDLADFIDVFCEESFFTEEQTETILTAALKYGLKPKIHANQMSYSNAIKIAVNYNALSVDHIEYLAEDDIDILKNSETMPTVLPGAAFYLNLPLTPVNKLIENDVPIAAATDYNPGSSPSGNMNFILSLLCIKYKMLPSQAIAATTINSAYAMNVEHILGTISPGKLASFIITKPVSSYECIPYYFGNHIIDKVFIEGKEVFNYSICNVNL